MVRHPSLHRTRRLVVGGMALATALLVGVRPAACGSDDRRPPEGTPPWLTAGTDQGPPPPFLPLLVGQFEEIASSYELIGSRLAVSFRQWLLMNGVSDPREQRAMFLLWKHRYGA